MKLNRAELINLYDSPQKDGGFATAISALSGEEFGIGLLQRYLAEQGKRTERLYGVPTTGNRSGFRLDGWLLIEGELAQIEVKNWGANAIGGRKYDGNPTAGWNQFLAWFKDPGLRKVLYPMRPPSPHTVIRYAVACMWPVMNHSGENSPWFSFPVADLPPSGFETPFETLHVFSMSGYLHSLTEEWVEIPMPISEHRLQRLASLFRHSESGG